MRRTSFALFCLIFLQSAHPCVVLAQSRTAHPPVAKTGAPPIPVNEYASIDKKSLEMPDSSTSSTDGIAAYINANFSKSIDKARASFIWIATNIQYDLANMFALNFYEKKDDKIAKPLKTRKGICENYAALFNDICAKTGIKSFVVEGYTKQNGFTDYIPHAWCAAYIDTAWFLFDPTWGSGYVSNGQFFNRINNDYFKVSPGTLIRSHMPFDYLWQLLYYPITSQEFYEGNTKINKAKPLFNYPDSIALFERQTEVEYYDAEARRIEANGIRNSLLYDRLQHIRREVEIDKQKAIVDNYNTAGTHFNKAVGYFNEFINYRNKQFKPEKNDSTIQAMLDVSTRQLKEAADRIDNIKNPDANAVTAIANFRKQSADLTARINEQQEWLKKYFSKGKGGRKSMFTGYTWMGIPVK